MVRASLLYLVAFAIVVIMLYFTGFRRVRMNFTLNIGPLRAVLIYVVAFCTTFLVYSIFNVFKLFTFIEVYKAIAAAMISSRSWSCYS